MTVSGDFYLPWHEAVETVAPYVFQILTPRSLGTGFLISISDDKKTGVVATAAHVINDVNYWEQPLRLVHKESGKTLLLRATDRAIFPDNERDTAVIIFEKQDMPLPESFLDLSPEEKSLKVGNEIAWLGFPAMAAAELCFFSGRISAYQDVRKGYLVDGVAINGVSGGPAFWNGGRQVTLMGVMSAYIPNRATGEALPGLAVVANVDQLHQITKAFKSVEEAKEQEPSPSPSEGGT